MAKRIYFEQGPIIWLDEALYSNKKKKAMMEAIYKNFRSTFSKLFLGPNE